MERKEASVRGQASKHRSSIVSRAIVSCRDPLPVFQDSILHSRHSTMSKGSRLRKLRLVDGGRDYECADSRSIRTDQPLAYYAVSEGGITCSLTPRSLLGVTPSSKTICPPLAISA